MKKVIILLYSLLLLNLVATGSPITKVYKATPYNRIAIIGSYRVNFEQSKSPYISIKGKGTIINRIKVSVKDGLLIVEMIKERDKRMRVKNDDLPVINIPLNAITNINLDGYTEVASSTPLRFNSLMVTINGASKLTLNLTGSNIVLETSGASYINLRGSTKNFALIMNGAGMFDGFDFKTNTSSIQINGSGKSRMNAKESLTGNISGFGTLYYKGSPKLNVTKSFGIVKQIP